MDRKRQCTSVESAHLCEACLFANNDPITSVGQTRARFWQTVAEKFAALNPRNEDSRGRYIARLGTNEKGKCAYESKPIEKQFKLVSRDVQKFSLSLQLIYNSGSTGSVTRKQIDAMTCAIHTGRTGKMEYRFLHDVPREQWTNYDSLVVLQDSPKFSISGTAGERDYAAHTSEHGNGPRNSGSGRAPVSVTELDSGEGGHNGAGRGSSDEAGEAGANAIESAAGKRGSESAETGERRTKIRREKVPIGLHAAKETKTDKVNRQQRILLDKRISYSLETKFTDAKMRTAILADTNMLLACSSAIDGETEEDVSHRMELMRANRKSKLKELKAKLSKLANGSGDSEVGVDADIDDDDDIL